MIEVKTTFQSLGNEVLSAFEEYFRAVMATPGPEAAKGLAMSLRDLETAACAMRLHVERVADLGDRRQVPELIADFAQAMKGLVEAGTLPSPTALHRLSETSGALARAFEVMP